MRLALERPQLGTTVDFETAQALADSCWCEDAIPCDPVPKEKAHTVMDEAMNWLRNNEVKPGDVDVDVLRALPADSSVPMPKR
jgi:hypothetical protein